MLQSEREAEKLRAEAIREAKLQRDRSIDTNNRCDVVREYVLCMSMYFWVVCVYVCEAGKC